MKNVEYVLGYLLVRGRYSGCK